MKRTWNPATLADLRQLPPFLVLSLPVLAFAAFITWRFPVYFHWDDVTYLQWAQIHRNPLAIFHPSESTLFGTYRPALLLAWWGLFRLFGLNAACYQFFLTALYGFTFVLYGLLLRRLYNGRVAIFSLLGYLVVFFPLGYVIFWFSDLTFVLELFWINLALLLLLSGLTDPGPRLFWGLAAFLGAIMTKEPSALIMSAVLVIHVWSGRRDLAPVARRRAAWLLPLLVIAGLAWLFLSPSVGNRLGIREAATLTAAVRFAGERWSYYAAHLCAHGGPLLWLSTFFLCGLALARIRSNPGVRGSLVVLALAAGLSVLLRRHPATALICLLVAGLPIVLARPRAGIGFAWGFVPLLALLSIKFYIRTYLAEASFGFAVLIGLAGEELHRTFEPFLAGKAGRYVRIGLVAAGVGGLVLFSGLVRNKVAALQILSDNRQNFRDVSEFLLGLSPSRGTALAVVTYGDMELSYRYGVQFMADEEKGGLQKTMEPYDLPVWFRLTGRPDLRVYPTVREYLSAKEDTCLVWAMNNREKKHLDGISHQRTLLYQVHRRGEGAWLYQFTR